MIAFDNHATYIDRANFIEKLLALNSQNIVQRQLIRTRKTEGLFILREICSSRFCPKHVFLKLLVRQFFTIKVLEWLASTKNIIFLID
jgi:hypothetical protein